MVTVQEALDSSVNFANKVQEDYWRDNILVPFVGALIWVGGPVSQNFSSAHGECLLLAVAADEVMATLNWMTMAEDGADRIEGDSCRAILVVCNSW